MLKKQKNLNRVVIYLNDALYAILKKKAKKRLISENMVAKTMLEDKLTKTELL